MQDAQTDRKQVESAETGAHAESSHIRAASPAFAKPEATTTEQPPMRRETPAPEPYKPETQPATAQRPPVNEMPYMQAPRYEREPATPAPKKKKKKIFLLVSAILVVVAIAVVAVLLSAAHKKKVEKYDEGTALLERGKYEEAKEIFLELKNFNDSPEKADIAQKGIDYESAVKKMNKERYDEAKKIFDSLGDFKDSAELSAECQRAIDYENALELYEAGNFAEAEVLFKKVKDFRDAEEYTAKCGAHADFAEAKSLMDAGDYIAARELLTTLDSSVITDRDTFITECNNMIDYNKAKELLAEGENYDAYKLFKKLGSFLDSSTLASSCYVSMPKTSETYRNSKYSSTSTSLTIKPPTGDGSKTYIKIYSESGSLVSCIFINAGDQVKVKLPGGTYRFKAAYSFGKWFGEKDMFGDEGVYQTLQFANNSDFYTLKSKSSYTLTLRTSKKGNVTTRNEKRDGF